MQIIASKNMLSRTFVVEIFRQIAKKSNYPSITGLCSFSTTISSSACYFYSSDFPYRPLRGRKKSNKESKGFFNIFFLFFDKHNDKMC